MGLVIDTSALVAVEPRPVAGRSESIPFGAEPLALPAIVLAELLAGVELADTPSRRAERRSRIDALLRRVPVVPEGEERFQRVPDLRVEVIG